MSQRQLYLLEDFFKIPNVFFKVLGFLPFGFETSRFGFAFKILLAFSLVNLGAILAAESATIFVVGAEDFVRTTSCAACTLFGAMGLEALFTTWRHRNDLKVLINYLRCNYPASAGHQRRLRLSKVYKESRALMVTFSVVFVSLISSFNFSPVFLNAFDYFSGVGKFKLEFPFDCVYPFDPAETTTRYVTMYLLEMWAGFTAVLSVLALNLFIGACVTQLSVQLEGVKDELRVVVDSSEEDFETLRRIVERHNQIIKGSELLENTFRVSLLVNYILGSLMLCLALFQCIIARNYAEVFKFILFLVSVTLQSLILSNYGDQIITQSTSVGETVYRGLWFERRPKMRKWLLLVILRSQRPLKISAYKVVTISFVSFFKIVSSSYSYFTLLRFIYNNGDHKY